MKTYINHPVHSTKMRVLSAFMAFLVLMLTFQEALVGWDFGASVKATADGNIHSTTTDKTSNQKTVGSSFNGFTYTGKYTNNNKVTVFDYVTDYEIAGTYNTCYQVESGYTDPFTTFNSAISNTTGSYSAKNNNITLTVESNQNGGFGQDDNLHVYLWNNSNNNSWPGAKMTYIGNGKYTYTFTESGWIPSSVQFNKGNSSWQTKDVNSAEYQFTFSRGNSYEFTCTTKVGDRYDVSFPIIGQGKSLPVYKSGSTSYNTPLYFGAFIKDTHAGESDADNYTLNNTPPYNNFFWQANIGLKDNNFAHNTTYGQAVVQGLVSAGACKQQFNRRFKR